MYGMEYIDIATKQDRNLTLWIIIPFNHKHTPTWCRHTIIISCHTTYMQVPWDVHGGMVICSVRFLPRLIAFSGFHPFILYVKATTILLQWSFGQCRLAGNIIFRKHTIASHLAQLKVQFCKKFQIHISATSRNNKINIGTCTCTTSTNTILT